MTKDDKNYKKSNEIWEQCVRKEIEINTHEIESLKLEIKLKKQSIVLLTKQNKIAVKRINDYYSELY